MFLPSPPAPYPLPTRVPASLPLRSLRSLALSAGRGKGRGPPHTPHGLRLSRHAGGRLATRLPPPSTQPPHGSFLTSPHPYRPGSTGAGSLGEETVGLSPLRSHGSSGGLARNRPTRGAVSLGSFHPPRFTFLSSRSLRSLGSSFPRYSRSFLVSLTLFPRSSSLRSASGRIVPPLVASPLGFFTRFRRPSSRDGTGPAVVHSLTLHSP